MKEKELLQTKRINLCFPVLSNYAGLANAINSACNGEVKPDVITVMDNGGNFEELFEGTTEVNGVPLKIIVPEANLGVAGSWNFFLRNSDDYVIISNDDITFKSDTVKLLVEAAIKNPNEVLICPDAYWEHYFSLYLLTKKGFNEIGEFDENFYPCYFEDRDYLYRLKLKGYNKFVVKDCTYEHIDGGSQTSRSSVSGDRFKAMLDYYIKKWGGAPECEKFTVPFNGVQ